MKTTSSYLYGFSATLKSLRLLVAVYLGYLFVGLLLAVPFYGLFLSASGHSELPDLLMKGFDATAIRELLAGGGKAFGFYLQSFWPWIFALLLFQVYLNGGIFYWVANPRGKFSFVLFHAHARKFFWRYLKLMVYFLITHLIIGLILYLPYMLTVGMNDGLTDQQLMRPLIVIMGIHLVLLVFIFILSDLSKSRLFEQDSRKVLKTIWKCLKIAIKRFFPTFFLGLLLLIIPLVIFGGFYLLRKAIVVDTTFAILLVFVLQQVVIFLRVGIRIWRLASVYRYNLYLTSSN
ncbi:MAG: hypothetical protein WC699_10040 [Bacteroidales bacterium]|jgi:hypothetical protein